MHSNDSSSKQFMFLIVGYGWDQGLSPTDAGKALDAMMAWVQSLDEQGLAVSNSPLARMGKMVSGKHGSITDGPFAEAKEVVGGYIVIKAPDLDAAAAVAQGCPLLEHGVTLDVREMVHTCSIAQRLQTEAERNAA
jgi:hypothetical protein